MGHGVVILKGYLNKCRFSKSAFPRGLKPVEFAGFMYGLKPVPFNFLTYSELP
jgi:hypothetical protein